jgi:large subunit ribosomal protein L18
MANNSRSAARIRRHARVRKHVFGTPERPRLCVFRSLNDIYAQVIDDIEGHTLVSASSIDSDLRGKMSGLKKPSRPVKLEKRLLNAPRIKESRRSFLTGVVSVTWAG